MMERTTGILPVRPHLRPKADDYECWVLSRDRTGQLLLDAVTPAEAEALPVEGEA